MKLFPATFLTVLLTFFLLSARSQAASLTPRERTNLVVDWFTGLFDNSKQVATEPEVPFLNMQNCAVSTVGGVADTSSQYVHLEQYINGNSLLRSSGYEFSPTNSAVSLKVYSYSDRDAALGTCNEADPTIDLSNLAFPSCDLTLNYQSMGFFGTNSPTGCPSSFPFPGSTVVSSITITANGVVSLDLFSAPGLTPFGTEIEFRAVATTNEPIGAIALIGLGSIAFIQSLLRQGNRFR